MVALWLVRASAQLTWWGNAQMVLFVLPSERPFAWDSFLPRPHARLASSRCARVPGFCCQGSTPADSPPPNRPSSDLHLPSIDPLPFPSISTLSLSPPNAVFLFMFVVSTRWPRAYLRHRTPLCVLWCACARPPMHARTHARS